MKSETLLASHSSICNITEKTEIHEKWKIALEMLIIENINIESNAMTKYLEYNYIIILLIKCLSFFHFWLTSC